MYSFKANIRNIIASIIVLRYVLYDKQENKLSLLSAASAFKTTLILLSKKKI